jgi:hypothetical protein
MQMIELFLCCYCRCGQNGRPLGHANKAVKSFENDWGSAIKGWRALRLKGRVERRNADLNCEQEVGGYGVDDMEEAAVEGAGIAEGWLTLATGSEVRWFDMSKERRKRQC